MTQRQTNHTNAIVKVISSIGELLQLDHLENGNGQHFLSPEEYQRLDGIYHTCSDMLIQIAQNLRSRETDKVPNYLIDKK